MWDEEFSESTLYGEEEVIIWCPDIEARRKFLSFMNSLDLRWAGGAEITQDYAEEAYDSFRVFRTGDGKLRLKRGHKEDYEDGQYNHCKRCTYYGDEQDLECSSDSELIEFFGISEKGATA